MKLAVAAGGAALVALIVVVLVVSTSGGSPGHAVTTLPPVDKPLVPVQEYRDTPHGVVVNVPAGWHQNPARDGTFMDFVDPQDAGRWVRIDVEKAGGPDGTAVLQQAARRFQTGTGCPHFQQLGLTDARLAGHDGAVLEYTCAPAKAAPRHGIWLAIVVGGQSYSVTLSVPASQFAGSRVIFDEMVRSFRLST